MIIIIITIIIIIIIIIITINIIILIGRLSQDSTCPRIRIVPEDPETLDGQQL